MFAQALIAFLAMPGLVAFAVPIAWLRSVDRLTVVAPWGIVPLVLGCLGLVWCVRDFYARGKGTLAPWLPPANLVVVGIYRYTRNPMYIAVTLILLGWAASFGVPGLYVYALGIATAFHLRVVLGEEPWLAQAHGAQWREHARRVPR